MSTAMALEFTRDWLRGKFAWNYTNCGVHYDAVPPNECASPFYISIDDAGAEGGDNDITDSLKETFSIKIGVWRKPEHLHADLRGMMKLPSDLYLLGAQTLDRLERSVIVHKTAEGYEKNGLHRNYQFVKDLNTRYNLPNETLGDKFCYPFLYRGKGTTEEIGLVDGRGNVQTWIGYKLRFRGLKREQSLRSLQHPVG